MEKGFCKLCLEYKELCKESHIIPRFMYKFLIEENNKLVIIDAKRSKTVFNSEYEGKILCQNCDSIIIGRLDDYAAKFLHGEFREKLVPRSEKMDGKDVVVWENDPNYDYTKFKLFLLSVLWRSSVSSRPFFQRVKLSKDTEEDLRQRILKGQPGAADEYPCFINLPPVMTDQNGNTGFHTAYMPTMSPFYIEDGDLRMCQFVIQGVHYYFLVTRPSNMNVLPAVEENKLTVGFNTPEQQQELIQQILAAMKGHDKYKGI